MTTRPRLPPVLLALSVLVVLQLAGTALSAVFALPVPGTVVGLVLLVALGVWRRTRVVADVVEPAATPLLAHLQLLFVPPGVGVLVELSTLAHNALPLAVAIGGSFVAALLTCGWLLQALLRRAARPR